MDDLIKYSNWKLKEGVFENYAKRKPKGFWERKETHRYALQWICKKLNWEFPYGLYGLKKDHLHQFNLDGLGNYYSISPINIVTSVLNDFDWRIWKFQMVPMGFWENKKNKLEYLFWLENKIGIKKPDGWYTVGLNDFYDNYGRTLVITYFDGSIYSVADYLYPDFKFDPWKFKRTPTGELNLYSITDVKEMIVKIAYSIGYKYPEDYFKLSLKDDLKSIKLGNFNVDSVGKLFNLLFNENIFYDWKFTKTPNKYWESKSNIISYTKWLYNVLEMESLEDWYDVNNNIIKSFFGGGLLGNGLGKGLNIYDILILTYPFYEWDPTKLDKKNFSSQKRLFKVLKKIFPKNEIHYNKRHKNIINPKTNHPSELDCFIPEINLAFEFQRIQHNEKHRFFHSDKGKKSFDELKFRDDYKKKRCKDLGITLIEIFEGKWDYSKEDLIKLINSKGKII